ncbi:MAG: DUF4168 domain-containing protein [Pleurocapsa sp.]
MMFKVNFTLLKPNKLYVRLLTSSALALVSLMGGLVPEISTSSGVNQTSLPTVSLSTDAHGQQVTPEETENYAKAGYQVELLRRKVYQEIKNLINEPPPNIVCDQQDTLNNLKPQVREIANRYCNQSQQIVQQNNLTINRFNQLKADYDRRDSFYQQVQSILLRLQN